MSTNGTALSSTNSAGQTKAALLLAPMGDPTSQGPATPLLSGPPTQAATNHNIGPASSQSVSDPSQCDTLALVTPKSGLQLASRSQSMVPHQSLCEFRHGHVEFSNARRAKFIIVPRGTDDPKVILQTMCNHWKLTLPQLFVNLMGGTDVQEAMYSNLQHPEVWGETPQYGEMEFNAKLRQLFIAIATACGEGSSWINGGWGSVCYGENGKNFQSRYEMMGTGLMEESMERRHDLEQGVLVYERPLEETFGNHFFLEKSAPLGEEAAEWLMYPDLRSYFVDRKAGKVLLTSGNSDPRPDPSTVISPFCTHMILWESKVDMELASLFTYLETVVPTVCLLVGGMHPEDTNAAIAATRVFPVIVFSNTGGSADEFTDALVRAKEGVPRRRCCCLSSCCCPDPVVFKLPSTLNKAHINIIDAKTSSTNHVVEKVINSIIHKDDEDRSFGNMDADTALLNQSWQLHYLWKENARKQAQSGTTLHYFVIAIAVLTTIMCIVASEIARGSATNAVAAKTDSVSDPNVFWKMGAAISDDPVRLFSLLVAILPMLSAFLITMNDQFEPMLKWAQLDAVSLGILSEIFIFRARIGEYMTRANMQDDEGDSGKSTKKKMDVVTSTPRRSAFAMMVNEMRTEVSQGKIENDALTPEVEPCCPCWVLPERSSGRHVSVEDAIPDDGFSNLTGKNYIDFRLMPQLERLEKLAPKLHAWSTFLQIMIFLLTGVNAAFALLSFIRWIPLVVVIGCCFASIMDFHKLEARLMSVNKTAMTLGNLLVWWDGLSFVEKRSYENKERLVFMCEEALSSCEQVYAGQGGSARDLRRKMMGKTTDEEQSQDKD